MKNKRFCDLNIGDNIYLKIDKTIETYCIKDIENVKSVLKTNIIRFNFCCDRYLDFNLDKNKQFYSDLIIEYGDVKISTSIDRLLLESDVNA